MKCPYPGCIEGAIGYHHDPDFYPDSVAYCMKGHKFIGKIYTIEEARKLLKKKPRRKARAKVKK